MAVVVVAEVVTVVATTLLVVVVVVVVVETWGANQVLIATGFMIFMGDEGNEGGTGGNKLFGNKTLEKLR